MSCFQWGRDISGCHGLTWSVYLSPFRSGLCTASTRSYGRTIFTLQSLRRSRLHPGRPRILKRCRYYIGWLCVGINSSNLSYFAVAFLSQWWLRTRHPRWFTQYNYIIGAGELRQVVVECVEAESWSSSRWRDSSDGVYPLFRSPGCGGDFPSFPKLVGRGPRWKLRPLCIPDIVRALAGVICNL